MTRAAGDGSLRTARLDLLPWPAHHPGLVAELTADPQVTRYLGTGALWAPEQCERMADGMQALWAEHGFGARAAIRRSDGVAIGMAITCLVGEGVGDLDPTAHELGWWIGAAYWRRGYGKEIGHALRAEAHDVLGKTQVLARLQAANLGSAAIAQGIGLTYDHDTVGRFGEPNVIYTGVREEPPGADDRPSPAGAAPETK